MRREYDNRLAIRLRANAALLTRYRFTPRSWALDKVSAVYPLGLYRIVRLGNNYARDVRARPLELRSLRKRVTRCIHYYAIGIA
jgi:hypothetical protein